MKITEKIKRAAELVALIFISSILIIFSDKARLGAKNGLELAMSTIVPSLLPLLAVFLTIMKSPASALLSRLFGGAARAVFNLPESAFTAVLFGLTGGYPTGALLTEDLLVRGDIDREQAQNMLRFNFCGGCGFIITAVGGAVYKSVKTGALLFASNAAAAIIIGIALSFTQKRVKRSVFICEPELAFADALTQAVENACASVLNITAYIVLFSAVCGVTGAPTGITPIIEITNGICTEKPNLPLAAAYLSFGGFCIHFQLLGVIKKAGMKYWDFLLFRCAGAALSYLVMKLFTLIFPTVGAVFASSSEPVKMSSVNMTLSVLLIIGCAVCVFDINNMKNKV